MATRAPTPAAVTKLDTHSAGGGQALLFTGAPYSGDTCVPSSSTTTGAPARVAASWLALQVVATNGGAPALVGDARMWYNTTSATAGCVSARKGDSSGMVSG